jgi:hypothetical protein
MTSTGPKVVAQELVAEAAASRGSLDQTGDVGHHELGVAADHAEVGFGWWWVVGDLGPGRRMRAMRVLLPTLGKPTRATSAAA